MCRHHVESRVKLSAPNEESFCNATLIHWRCQADEHDTGCVAGKPYTIIGTLVVTGIHWICGLVSGSSQYWTKNLQIGACCPGGGWLQLAWCQKKGHARRWQNKVCLSSRFRWNIVHSLWKACLLGCTCKDMSRQGAAGSSHWTETGNNCTNCLLVGGAVRGTLMKVGFLRLARRMGHGRQYRDVQCDFFLKKKNTRGIVLSQRSETRDAGSPQVRPWRLLHWTWVGVVFARSWRKYQWHFIRRELAQRRRIQEGRAARYASRQRRGGWSALSKQQRRWSPEARTGKKRWTGDKTPSCSWKRKEAGSWKPWKERRSWGSQLLQRVKRHSLGTQWS